MKQMIFAALCTAWAGVTCASDQVTWKLATGYRAESFHSRNLEQFSQEIKSATNGRLVIELHTNNSLIKLADMRDAVEQNKVQAGESIMSGMTKEFPVSGADSVPFVVHTYSDAQRLWSAQRPLIEKTFAQRGLKVLYAVPWPPQGLYSKKPITRIEDFKGTTMRTYNPSTQRIAALLGAKGVDVPMVEVGKALREGRIDSMITSAVTGAENKVWGDIKYYYDINAWFPKNIVYVNLKSFNALPSSTQKAVLEAAQRAQTRGWQMSQTANQEATEELRKNGVKIDRVPHEVEITLKRLGEKFSREWVGSVGQDANQVFVPYYLHNIPVAETAVGTKTNKQ